MRNEKEFVILGSTEYETFPALVLEGNARGRRILTSKLTGSDKLMLGICTIMPGEEHGWHTHPDNEEEVNYIIEGRGLIVWKDRNNNERRKEVTTGDVIFTPGRIPNKQLNIGNEPFRFLYVLSPPRE